MAEDNRAESLESAVQQLIEQPMADAEVRSLARALGERVGVEDLELDRDGLATIAAEDAVVLLSCQQGFPGLTASVLLPNEPRARPLVYRRLLQANLSWAETGGGAFFLLPDDDTLVLAGRIGLAHRDLDRAAAELSQLVELARHWTTEIEMVSDLVEETPDTDGGETQPLRNSAAMIRP